MNKAQLISLLESLSVRPGKKFGQNFMTDANLAAYIVRQANITPGEVVLEIGPGCGALTCGLLDAGAKLVAVEIDKRIAEHLNSAISNPCFHLIRDDACKVNIREVLVSTFPEFAPAQVPWKCVSNLPYSISTPFIAKILDSTMPPQFMLLLLQKETAQRIIASPGSREYGAISVRSQALYRAKILRNVPPDVFFPRPDVDSALVSFDILPERPAQQVADTLAKIVRCSFAQRRKIMLKAVASLFGLEKTTEAFSSLNINKLARAQDLAPDSYIRLAIRLSSELQ